MYSILRYIGWICSNPVTVSLVLHEKTMRVHTHKSDKIAFDLQE